MSNNFHIAGTEDFGYSPERSFLYSFYRYMNTVQQVCCLYNYASVLDLRGYVAHFCYRKLKEFDTAFKVIVDHKDYISANCLLRMLGDSVSVFRLVYMETDPELRWLRHALYVLEGCEQNLKVLTDDDANRDAMPAAEYAEFKNGVRRSIEHRKRLMAEAQLILDKSRLAAADKEAFDKIVKDRNWKFKEFKNYKNVHVNQYKVAEMYKMIGLSDDFDLLSFISQYVHGLSMSNLVMEMNRENRDSVISIELALVNRLNEYALNFFVRDIRYIFEGFYDPKMRDLILACYDDVHRPTIEQWNEIVRNSYNRILEK